MKELLYTKFKELSNKLVYIEPSKIVFTVPKEKSFGDLATNYPMTIAKALSRNPREIAKEIIDNFPDSENEIEKVEIAGGGFLNFTFSPKLICNSLERVFNEKNEYGKSRKFSGKTAQVEYVSANPTGPLTVGHGRNAVIGDTIANLLQAVGYKVDREYYFNNAGRQMRVLGDSVRLRYLELCGKSIEFPEDYYQGEYIVDIAKKIYNEKAESLVDSDDISFFKSCAENDIFEDIKKVLSSLNIRFDNFFNENSLYENKKIEETIEKLSELGYTYDKDGAKWLALTKAGSDADKVIIKNTGEPTYRLPDIAYHLDKFKRDYDLMIDIFGSDHIATYPDVMASLKILGQDSDKIKVIIHQFVTVIKDGQTVKMSTRKANFITLEWLINEVSSDVVRYFFLMRSPGTHLNFDIDLAKKSSDENPVFYLQYAHARICGIIRLAESELISINDKYSLLITSEEQDLIKHLALFPEVIETSAATLDLLNLLNYLHSLAEKFHKFYHEHRVLKIEPELSSARLALCYASRIVLANGLDILGIKAPERM